MFVMNGTTIEMSKGDTAAIRFTATGYTFDADDRALFSVKDRNGAIVKQKAYQMTNNQFIVYFVNSDTDTLTPGDYTWDVRFIVDPVYDDNGNIVDGDQVNTPKTPQTLKLLAVVGDV